MTLYSTESVDRKAPVPLYYQIKESIKQDILSGKLAVGDRAPSEKDICDAYGVSRITAIRATNELESEGYLRKEPGRGTFVTAPAPRVEATHCLGIGLHESQYLFHPFFSCIVAGMSEVAAAAAYQVQLIVTNEDAGRTGGTLYEKMLSQKRVDGLAIVDHAVSDSDIIDLHTCGVPIVLFDRVVSGQDFYSMLVDNRGGTFQLMEHLFELGHRNIGFITVDMKHLPSRERYEGYRSALDIRGAEFHPEWVIEFDIEGSVPDADVSSVMQARERPTAFVCYDDYFAMQTIGILRKLGYRVPDDISVTGFDNIPQSQYTVPPLTTADTGLVDLGREMANVLLSSVRGEPVNSKRRLARAQLEIRGSTGPVNESA